MKTLLALSLTILTGCQIAGPQRVARNNGVMSEAEAAWPYRTLAECYEASRMPRNGARMTATAPLGYEEAPYGPEPLLNGIPTLWQSEKGGSIQSPPEVSDALYTKPETLSIGPTYDMGGGRCRGTLFGNGKSYEWEKDAAGNVIIQ